MKIEVSQNEHGYYMRINGSEIGDYYFLLGYTCTLGRTYFATIELLVRQITTEIDWFLNHQQDPYHSAATVRERFMNQFTIADSIPAPDMEVIVSAQDEANLLRIIRGDIRFLGAGLSTYPNKQTNNHQLLHNGCLALEAKGLIRRRLDDGDSILWEAV